MKRKAELQHGDEVAVWMAKSQSRGSRYGAGNNAAPTAKGSGCWCRATVTKIEEPYRVSKFYLRVVGGRTIPLPALRFVRSAPFDLHGPPP